MFILIVPGMCALVLFPRLESPDDAYATMISEVMPTGLRGIALAGVLAALMSTFASALNSTATLVVYDFVERLRPQTSERRKIRIGQVTILLVGLFGIIWAPFIDRLDESLWAYLMRVSMYLQAPIAGVFFLGILWRGTTGIGAVVGICIGCVIGALFLLVDFNQLQPPAALQPWLEHWTLRSFPHRAFAVVLVAIVVTALASAIQNARWPASQSAESRRHSIDWKRPQLFDASPKSTTGDWRIWLIGLAIFDAILYAVLR